MSHLPFVTQQIKNDYRVRGWTVIPDVFNPEWLRGLGDSIHSLATSARGSRVDAFAPQENNEGAPYGPEVMDEGGWYAYDYVSSDVLMQYQPRVQMSYQILVPMLKAITGEAVIQSPYLKSRVLGVSYNRAGDCQGYHRDTQPITALLYVEGAEMGAGTELHDFQGAAHVLAPPNGSLLVMQGRHIRHCSLALAKGRKIVLPMNYYTEQDTWRPKSLDSDDYWKTSKD